MRMGPDGESERAVDHCMTKEEIAKVLEAWDRDWTSRPDEFMSLEEVGAAIEDGDLDGSAQADYFLKLLSEVRCGEIGL